MIRITVDNAWHINPNIATGLYPTLSTKDRTKENKSYRNFLQYADGTNSLEKISSLIELDLIYVKKIYNVLSKEKLID